MAGEREGREKEKGREGRNTSDSSFCSEVE